jgi:hypothetical protein
MLHSKGYDPNEKLPDGTPNPNYKEHKAVIEAEETKLRGVAIEAVVKSLAEQDHNIDKAKQLFDRNRDHIDAKSQVAISKFLDPFILDQHKEEGTNGYFERGGIPHLGYTQPGVTRESMLAAGERERERTANAPVPGAKHPSDYFMHLESGGKGIGYINTHDTDGSHSYGNLGVNSRHGPKESVWSTSAGKFFLQNAALGLRGVPGTREADASWEEVARAKPRELRAAETKWWDEHYFAPVSPKLKAAGVTDSIANDKAVQYYMADRNVQQGPHTMDRAGHMMRFLRASQGAHGDPKLFIRNMNEIDKANVETDFPTALSQGPDVYSPRANDNRISGREAAARQAAGMPPAAGAREPERPSIFTSAEPRDADKASAMTYAEKYSAEHAGGSYKVKMAVYHAIRQEQASRHTSNAAEKHDLTQKLADLNKMYHDGVEHASLDNMGITPETILRVYGPVDGHRILEEHNIHEEVGKGINALKYSTQDQIDDFRREVESGQGIASLMMQHRKGAGYVGPGAIGVDPVADKAEHYRAKAGASAFVERWNKERQTALKANPADYMRGEKTVSRALEALNASRDSQDQAVRGKAFQDYALAQVAAQERAGLKGNDIHILPLAKAKKYVDDLIASPDAKNHLDQMAKEFGPAWNRVFNDMATIGGLSTKFEAVQYLDDYNARVLSGAIKQEMKYGAKETESRRVMEERLGTTPDGVDVVKAVNKIMSADGTMKQMLESFTHRGFSIPQQNEIIDSVRMLTYGRIIGAGGRPGETPDVAVSEAVKAFTAGHVFTKENAMIPAQRADDIKEVMRFVKDSITNQKVSIPHWTSRADVYGTPTERDYLERAKSLGRWVNTANGDGVEYRDHNNRTMRDHKGKPLTLMFNNIDEAQKLMRSTMTVHPQAPGEAPEVKF